MNHPRSLIGDAFTPEQQLLVTRILLGGAAIFVSYFGAFDALIIWALCAYVGANAVLFVLQKHGILELEKRLSLAMAFDIISAFVVMYHYPEQMSLFFPALLLLTLSTGFRFGIKWLLSAAALSTVAFGCLVMTTDYWQQNYALGLTLTVTLLAIPAYCSTLIRSISKAKAQAESASKAKSYFLASVSHELRTPLNAIIGYGNHLRQSNMPAGQKDMVEASVLAGEHLLHLIEQLIDVAKAGTGSTEVKRTAFRPTDLLAEIRDIMTVQIEEKGLALHLQAAPMSDDIISGPTSVIRNILLNLVGNAIKFTEVGCITISCGILSRTDKNAAWFAVSDTGIGIAESANQRIFQPFQQADDTVMNRFGGTGLGLSICKQLTEQVDGDISLKSQIGQGSTFRIEIPVETLEYSPNLNDMHAGADINVLAFGQMSPDLLSQAQAIENMRLRHIACADSSVISLAIGNLDLQQFQIVLLPERLAKDIATNDQIWTQFSDADIAPILVSNEETVALEPIQYPKQFTSVLSATPNIAELRSAVKIGCSLAPKMRMSNVEREKQTETYTPKRVLVADDNRTNRNILAAILEAAGHHVSMATDGDSALTELAKGETDILLLDVNMPRLNGIDACMMWRQSEGDTGHLPIIGITADATAETEAKCLQAGMDARITKPVNAQLLLKTIETYCSGSAATFMMPDIKPACRHDIVEGMSCEAATPIDAIDRTQIQYLRSIGDQAFVNNMVESFLEDINQTLDPVRRAVKNGDISEFRFCAHAFKSSGNNMGARALSLLCGQLEQINDADFSQHKHEYLAQIEQEITRAVYMLKTDVFTDAVPVLEKTG
ncbi:ATP-binding protein [Sphingorhabdus sp.]|jgi:two-component system sensor histidine kinase RpfC|uniref:ATP-binding protein n=1 Tax=Sphingorhabdus sp. TaxID=1902408 RepID=UPI0037C605D3